MKKLLLVFSFFFLLVRPAIAAQTEGVIVSIAPLHSLVQGVMGDTGQAELIVTGLSSPHGFQLKPSQVRKMQNANFIFYIGSGFESFLSKSFETLPDHIRKVSMTSSSHLEVLESRKGGGWEAHDHTAHMHDEHEDEHSDHDEHADHDDRKAEHDDHAAHDDQDDVHKHNDDHHVWLSPANGISMIKAIVKELGRVYPENRDLYKQNAKRMIAEIEELDQRLANKLLPLKDKPFIVFHDAFQYFEKHYQLTGVGSVLLEPDDAPSISRIQEIRQKIKDAGAVCIFQEPQFSDKIIRTVTEETSVKRGSLDPVGGSFAAGTGLYVKLLEKLADDFAACMG